MPLFEYRCNQCRHTFSLLVGMTAEKVKKECPRCGGRNLTKLVSRPARIVKSDALKDDLGGPNGDADYDEYGSDLDDDLDDE